jgi:hypothetical protein
MVSRLLPAPTKGVTATFRRELDPTYMGGYGWGVAATDVRKLEELCESYDMVWVQRSLLSDALGRWHWPRAVVDVDDLLSQYYETRARRQRNPMRFLVDMRRSWLWRRREARLPERFASVVVCSEADKQSLGNGDRNVVPKRVPALITVILTTGSPGESVSLASSRRAESRRCELVHRSCVASGTSQVPDAEFRSSEPAPMFDGSASWRHGSGHLDQSCGELETWSCAVVPLRVGAGTRVKIAEAFARGLPVVSTSRGCVRICRENGRELLPGRPPLMISRRRASQCSLPGVAGDARTFRQDALREPAIGEHLARARQASGRSRLNRTFLTRPQRIDPSPRQ